MSGPTTDLIPTNIDLEFDFSDLDIEVPEPEPYVFDPYTPTHNLIVPKTSDKGIKVDTASPTFPWHDLLGRISIRSAGAGNPTFAVYTGNIRQFNFAVGEEAFNEFHMPHDYVMGSDLFIHAHWSLAVGGILEDITWSFDISYAKGHNQASFSTPVTVSVTETSNTTAFRHMVTEVQMTGPGLIDKSLLEPDGLILVRTRLTANTGVTKPFLHTVDIHYQSTGIGTKQKAPNFHV